MGFKSSASEKLRTHIHFQVISLSLTNQGLQETYYCGQSEFGPTKKKLGSNFSMYIHVLSMCFLCSLFFDMHCNIYACHAVGLRGTAGNAGVPRAAGRSSFPAKKSGHFGYPFPTLTLKKCICSELKVSHSALPEFRPYCILMQCRSS